MQSRYNNDSDAGKAHDSDAGKAHDGNAGETHAPVANRKRGFDVNEARDQLFGRYEDLHRGGEPGGAERTSGSTPAIASGSAPGASPASEFAPTRGAEPASGAKLASVPDGVKATGGRFADDMEGSSRREDSMRFDAPIGFDDSIRRDDPMRFDDSLEPDDPIRPDDPTESGSPSRADNALEAGGPAAVGAGGSVGSNSPSSFNGPVGLQDATIKVPPLREKRDRGEKDGKRNLLPDAKPEIRDAEDQPIDGLRLHRDYELAYLHDKDGQPDWSDDALERLTDAGAYWVIVRGTSSKLRGTTQQRFEVGKPRRRWPWAVLAALLAAVAVGVALYFAGFTPWYDPNANEGLAGLEGEDLQAYLDAKVEEGSMNITVVTPLVFTQGTTNQEVPGKIAFNNLAANHVDQRLRITLDDTGELVCETGAISPGQNIEYVTLNRELAPGAYEATATVTGFDRETHAEKGSLAAKIQIVVHDQTAG